MLKQIKIFYVFSFFTTLMGFIFIFFYKTDVYCSALPFDNVFETSTIDEYLKIRRTSRDHLSRKNCRTLLFSLVECMVKDKTNLTLQNFSLILELGKAGNVEFFKDDSGYFIGGKFYDINRTPIYYRSDDPRRILNFKFLESIFYHLPLTQLDYFYLMMECKKALDLGINEIDGYEIRNLKIALDICLMDHIDMLEIQQSMDRNLSGTVETRRNYGKSDYVPMGFTPGRIELTMPPRSHLDWTALRTIYAEFGFTGLQYIFDGQLTDYSLRLYSQGLGLVAIILITSISIPFFK